MIVHFVEVGGIVDCQFLSFLSIINNKNRTSFIKISYIEFVKDPIYRTKVIVWKRPCCQKIYL
jgi:hypothetical protein